MSRCFKSVQHCSENCNIFMYNIRLIYILSKIILITFPCVILLRKRFVVIKNIFEIVRQNNTSQTSFCCVYDELWANYSHCVSVPSLLTSKTFFYLVIIFKFDFQREFNKLFESILQNISSEDAGNILEKWHCCSSPNEDL